MPPARSKEAAELLSSSAYDKDASLVTSGSEDGPRDEDTEATDGDERTSAQAARFDWDVLESEEERERLLAGSRSQGGLEGDANAPRASRSKNNGGKRRRPLRNGETVFEMEEGGKRGSSSDSLDSLGAPTDEKAGSARRGKPWLSGRRELVFIHVLIAILFFIFLYAAYAASSKYRQRGRHNDLSTMLSNGTSLFAPTTILISLDGFRADFLHRNLTPTLNSFIQNGVSPRYMLPSFPSLTFPNHFTLATGLYPESHGIVGNTFWDPSVAAEFFYTDPARSMQPQWWGGEPMWNTAEMEGLTTAVHMWPGSEAHIGGMDPTYLDKYNGSEPLSRKVDRILKWLDLPGPKDPGANAAAPRPQLIVAYVPNVDRDGHRYGPNSTEIRGTIESVDDMLASLFNGLTQRNLSEIVNVVVVSDHGMATTSIDRLVQLDDIIDLGLIEHIDGWPLYGLRAKRDEDVQRIHDRLAREAQSNPGFDVYLRENMPARYHFSSNPRIAPLWIVPKTGWAIVTKDEFDVAAAKADGLEYHPKGLHGYDFENPLMRAIFVAHGPAFPHVPGSEVDVFQNTEVYNIICDSLRIEPKPNNGTLRLPLRTMGVHERPPPGEIPYDPPHDDAVQTDNGSAKAASDTSMPVIEKPVAQPTRPVVDETSTDDTSEAEPTRPIIERPTAAADDDHQKEEEEHTPEWWAWVKDKLKDAEGWIKDVFDKEEDEKERVGE